MPEEKVSLSNQPQPPPPVPGEPAYAPPAASVPLPSLGKVYPVGSSLAGKSRLEIKAMTAREEDILTSRGLLRTGTALDALLRSCIIDRSVDIGSMLVGDRNAVLVAIRITGYGQEYKVQVDCPACGEKVKHEFDLSQIPIKQLSVDPRAPGTNEFVFNLPVSKADVVFKLLSGADEKELGVIIDRSRKMSGGGAESLVTTRLVQQVISIGGETDPNKLALMVRNMPARDSRALRFHIDRMSPGLNMTQLFRCTACGEESEVDVPMGTEFFWPQS